MLNRVEMSPRATAANSQIRRSEVQKSKNNATNVVSFTSKPNYSAAKLAGAYRGYNNIRLASTVSFKGGSLAVAFDELNQAMVTCQDIAHGQEGEEVGKRVNVSELVSKFQNDLPRYDDAIKTTIPVSEDKDDNKKVVSITDARTQIKKGKDNAMKFEMVVRMPRKPDEDPGWTENVQQIVNFEVEPNSDDEKHTGGTQERSYVLNTKGKLMSVVENDKNVILTNAGSIKRKGKGSKLNVNATQYVKARTGADKGKYVVNEFKPFSVDSDIQVRQREGGSTGGGTELVIGLENGRFVPEIIDSVETFEKKVNNGDIVLDKFVPAKNAKNIQISMLAGGFGSRAEYANASSSKIMHNKQDGSNLTKGCFRTATGLTPMETTFISLHKAGLLDCSKDNFGIGKNIKFYLNDSGTNTGNGGFSIGMYNTMEREGRESLMIFPNDAMSRIPNAITEMTDIMNSKKAAVVMVAKQVNKEDARGSLGIMKINDAGEIEAFAEKPKEFAEGYVDKNDNCFANTFQFAVSKEAFHALSIVEPYLPDTKLGKESRDWSKVLTPVLMAITQNDDPAVMQKQIKDSMEGVKEFKNKNIQEIPTEALAEAKKAIGDQKIYAVKTSEPWADCGTLNALYHTTMEIASGAFPLEDFERKHVLDSVNTKTGLVASTPEQKKETEAMYETQGQVMVVPKADPVSFDVVDRNADAITRFSDVA